MQQAMNDGHPTRTEVRALDDAALMRACAEELPHAWDAFVDRFGRYVYFLVRVTARRHGVPVDDAVVGDLYGDAFVAFLDNDRRRLRQFEGRNGCSARSWVRVIVIRTTLNSMRKLKRHRPLESVPEPVDARHPLDALIEAEDAAHRARLAELTCALPAKDRLLLDMLYQQRMPIDAVAAALRTSRGAVYTRKSRLVARLREEAHARGWADEA